MPRKPKTSVEDKAAIQPAAPSVNGKSKPAEPKKKTRASGTTSKKPTAPKKSPAKTAQSPAPKPPVEPTDDQIRLRAYFLAERRHRLALPGDSNHDWIEARRQLIEEAQRTAN